MATQTAQKPDQSVKQKKGSPAASTQLYMDIAEIKDNIAILKNGGVRAVLQTTSVNFNLKSEEEQNSIIYAYQSFLNSLDFPIQIVVRSRKLDIEEYVDTVRKAAEEHESELLKTQTNEYAEYIEKLIEYADIMEKTFFVVVPYDPYRTQNTNMFSKFMERISAQDSVDAIKRRHKEFEELAKHLGERVNTVKAGLESCNLKVAQLTTQQLIELYYNVYNPSTSQTEKIEDIAKVDVEAL